MISSIKASFNCKHQFIALKHFLLIFAAILATGVTVLISTFNYKYETKPEPFNWKTIHQLEIDYWRNIRVDTMTPENIIQYFSIYILKFVILFNTFIDTSISYRNNFDIDIGIDIDIISYCLEFRCCLI